MNFRRQDDIHRAYDDAETWRICRSLLQQGVAVEAVAALGAEDPVCVETVDTGDAVLIFSQRSR